jgi:ATP-dependent protease Clp ATPase subunit
MLLAGRDQELRHQRDLAQIEQDFRLGQETVTCNQAVALDRTARDADARVAQTQQRMAAVNKNLKLLLAGGSLATVGVLAAYFMFRKYAQTRPTIIEDGDTSIGTLFKKAKFPEPRLDSLVLTPELEHLVRNKFEALEIAILNKLPLSNMMFYGPPGTGKTMAAQEFMRHLSKLGIADHIIIRGPAFRRFSTTSEAVDALASMLRFALYSYRKRKRPCLVFFDEADVLFADRLNPAISTDISRNAVVTLTSLLPAAISKEIMCIFSANNKKDFDIAIFDRVDASNQIYFPLPGQKEREALLRLYLNEHVVKNGLVVAPEVDAHIGDVAHKLEGLSGRQISSTVVQSMYPLLNKGETELTLPLLEGVIRDRVRATG